MKASRDLQRIENKLILEIHAAGVIIPSSTHAADPILVGLVAS
jgi:hypothetical protein